MCLFNPETNSITIANAGDARALLIDTVTGRCDMLSTLHKPSAEEELKRIEAAGGQVNMAQDRIGYYQNGLVSGLNMSRSIGDFFYKSNTKLNDWVFFFFVYHATGTTSHFVSIAYRDHCSFQSPGLVILFVLFLFSFSSFCSCCYCAMVISSV